MLYALLSIERCNDVIPNIYVLLTITQALCLYTHWNTYPTHTWNVRKAFLPLLSDHSLVMFKRGEGWVDISIITENSIFRKKMHKSTRKESIRVGFFFCLPH